jgi:hypothetical protein
MYKTRLIALLKIAGGVVGMLIVRAIIPQYPLLAALPLAFAFAGLLEVISGIPFMQLQTRWDSMPYGQRYLLGLAIALSVIGGIIFYIKTGM